MPPRTLDSRESSWLRPLRRAVNLPFLSLSRYGSHEKLAARSRKRNGDRESNGPGAGLRGLTSARRQESPFSRRASPEALCVTPVPSSLPRQKGPPHLFFFRAQKLSDKICWRSWFRGPGARLHPDRGERGRGHRAASTTREVRRLWRGVVAPQRNSRGVVHGSGTARCCSARRAWARCA